MEDVKPSTSRIQEEEKKKDSTAEEEEEDDEEVEGVEYEDGESEVKGSITEYNRGCYSPDYTRFVNQLEIVISVE